MISVFEFPVSGVWMFYCLEFSSGNGCGYYTFPRLVLVIHRNGESSENDRSSPRTVTTGNHGLVPKHSMKQTASPFSPPVSAPHVFFTICGHS